MKILNDNRFNIEDFKYRWMMARISGLKNAIGDQTPLSLIQNASLIETELNLLAKATNKNLEIVLKNVFDNSRKLGLSLSKFLKLTFDQNDFADVLPQMEIPCFAGAWLTHNDAKILKRQGCSEFKKLGSSMCDYYREAFDGLIMGLGEEERLARHKSIGHGDDECLDVLFSEPATISIKTSDVPTKYGEISESIILKLDPIKESIEKMGALISFKGINEGKLYYSFVSNSDSGCGPGPGMIKNHFIQKLKKAIPEFQYIDTSPIAVLAGDA